MSTTNKTPWLLIILLVLLSAGGSVAGTYFLLKQTANAGAAPAVIEPPKIEAPLLVNVPALTINLQGPDAGMLYIGFAIQVGDAATQTFLEQYTPQIRSHLFRLLGELDSASLMSNEGKASLLAKIREVLTQPLATPQPELSVLDVLYTDFIVQ
jgi:flagellar FliL protein